MTKITSTTSTQTATPTVPVEAAEPATKPKADIAPSKKECAPESTPKDTWETGKEEKSEGFFSKLGQKIDQTIDDAKSTVKSAGETIQKTVEDVQQTVKSAGETVKKAASDAVNDGIDTIQQRANNAVDNLQQGIDNVQKNVNETIDAIQTLDAKTVKDIAVKHFVDEPIQTVKDVATVASKAIEMQQEIKKQQHEAVTKAVNLAFEKAPEILEAAKNATESFAKNTEEIIEKYAIPTIEEAYKEISTNTQAFQEKIEFYAQNPDELTRAAFHLEGEIKDLGTKLVGELAIVASDVVAKNQDVLRTALNAITSIEIPTPQGILFNQIKKALPEDSIAYNLAHLASRGPQGLIQDQLQSLARQIGNQAIDAAVKIDKDPEAFRKSLDVSSHIKNLAPGEEFNVGVSASGELYVEVGGKIEAGIALKASCDPKNPDEIVIELSAEAAMKTGVGLKLFGKGFDATVGGSRGLGATLKFDRNDPEQMKDMTALIKSYGRGAPSPLAMTVLPKYADKATFIADQSISTDLEIFKLGGNAALEYSINPKDGSSTITASVGIDASLGLDDFYMQIPSSLGIPTHSESIPNTDPMAKQVMDTLLGKNSLGLNISTKISAEAGVVFDSNKGMTPDAVKSIYLELKGDVQLNSKSCSGTLRAELHNPAELAKLLKTNVNDLVADFKAQTITIEDITQRLTALGADLERFIQIEGKVTIKEGHGFKLTTDALNLESMKYTVTEEPPFIKFPSGTNAPNTPQQLTQNDAAAAELRLLDRAFHA